MTKRELHYVPHEKWSDPDFCLKAVKKDGEALDWIPEKIITMEMCLDAVRQNGEALEYVPKAYYSEALFLEAGIRQLKCFYRWLENQYRLPGNTNSRRALCNLARKKKPKS